MAKRNPIRAFNDQNHSANYHNKRNVMFLADTQFSVITDAWECPDKSGFWFVTSIKDPDNRESHARVIKRVKVSRSGHILEERND